MNKNLPFSFLPVNFVSNLERLSPSEMSLKTLPLVFSFHLSQLKLSIHLKFILGQVGSRGPALPVSRWRPGTHLHSKVPDSLCPLPGFPSFPRMLWALSTRAVSAAAASRCGRPVHFRYLVLNKLLALACLFKVETSEPLCAGNPLGIFTGTTLHT